MTEAVSADAVKLTGGEEIEAGTVVCAIGNTQNELVRTLGLPRGPGERGRVLTEPDLRVRGFENVWAVGDCAHIVNGFDGSMSPPTAQFAVRQAKQLVDNLRARDRGRDTRCFSFRPLGMFATIGHNRAVGEIRGLRFSGFGAFFLWRGIYLAKMPLARPQDTDRL